MTDYVTSIAVDDIMDALISFLTPFVGTDKIVRAQVNRVANPPEPFAMLTELLTVDIDQPYQTYDPDNSKVELNGPKRIDVQIDFYGEFSSDICNAVKTAFKSMWSVDQFPSNIVPLYNDDGRQTQFVDGQQQYENRWTLTVSLQYNPIITVPQQFADEISVTKIEAVDIF